MSQLKFQEQHIAIFQKFQLFVFIENIELLFVCSVLKLKKIFRFSLEKSCKLDRILYTRWQTYNLVLRTYYHCDGLSQSY